jgi:hypothetical protein
MLYSYIANLDPHYIRALGETASDHQVGPLRDAIWSHLFLETSIRIKVSVSTQSLGGDAVLKD